MTTEPTAAQPAAPSPTPWTDQVLNYESYVRLSNHARSLEALCRQQQEVLKMWEEGNPYMLVKRDEVFAIYAALKKEMERGE